MKRRRTGVSLPGSRGASVPLASQRCVGQASRLPVTQAHRLLSHHPRSSEPRVPMRPRLRQPVVPVGEQVPAAGQAPERAAEQLDDPPPAVHLRDRFGRQAEPIRDRSEHPVTVRPVPPSAAPVRLHRHADEPHGMLRPRAVRRVRPWPARYRHADRRATRLGPLRSPGFRCAHPVPDRMAGRAAAGVRREGVGQPRAGAAELSGKRDACPTRPAGGTLAPREKGQAEACPTGRQEARGR